MSQVSVIIKTKQTNSHKMSSFTYIKKIILNTKKKKKTENDRDLNHCLLCDT